MLIRCSVVLAVFAATSTRGWPQAPNPKGEIDRVLAALSSAYQHRSVAQVGNCLAGDFAYSGQYGDRHERQDYLRSIGSYFAGISSARLTATYVMKSWSAGSARTTITWKLRDEYFRQGAPKHDVYWSTKSAAWTHARDGWKISHLTTISAEYQWPNGSRHPSPYFDGRVDAAPGGGVGAAPVRAFKALSDKTQESYADRNLKALAATLMPSYYVVDATGRRYSRAQAIASFASFFKTAHYVAVSSNHVLVKWSANSAELRTKTIVNSHLSRDGREVTVLDRQSSVGWWVHTASGWKLDHSKVISIEYADARHNWHLYGKPHLDTNDSSF